MKTMITGSSGLVGSTLVESLFTRGYTIQCLQRNRDRQSSNFWETQALSGENDSIIHLAGENVASGRWTQKKMDRILSSRVEGTRQLVDAISTLDQKPKVFLCASAVGYYGGRGGELLSEKSSPGEGFLAEVCGQWEAETDRLKEMGVRVVNLRFGMILSPRGGALHKMLPAFKLKLGGVVGSGKQFVSWISIRDVVGIIDFIIRTDHIRGPVNVVSPIQTTNKRLTKALAKALHGPALFKVPAFMARMVFGQMADEMLLASSRVTPQVLLEAGYEFRDKSLGAVLEYCVKDA